MTLLSPRSKGVSIDEAKKHGLKYDIKGVHKYKEGYHPGKTHEEFAKAYMNYLRSLKGKKNLIEEPPKKDNKPQLSKGALKMTNKQFDDTKKLVNSEVIEKLIEKEIEKQIKKGFTPSQDVALGESIYKLFKNADKIIKKIHSDE